MIQNRLLKILALSLYKDFRRVQQSYRDCSPLNVRQIGGPETSVRNYHYLLSNNPE